MTYYFFPLTEEETKDPTKLGYGYALKNKDRWIGDQNLVEVNTYDRGTTHIVYNDQVYFIHKDYLDITNNLRVYVGRYSVLGADQHD